MFRMSLSPCLQVPKVTKSLGLGSLHPHSLLFLAFQLGEYVMTQVPQGCCSVFDNPGTALVPLGAAERRKFMSLLPLNPFILRY